ncbi:MAG: MoxR family ATPase [Oscillospiraceae bacterium]|nr:MoxR family ATPase [Oscillospiraceae bacterium]
MLNTEAVQERIEKHVVQAKAVVKQVNQVILGKEREVEEVMLTFLAGGHVLLEDIPGVGKTTLATAFSKAMQLDCKRVQFTPDVMPSDLSGFSIYRREEEKFVYQPGSVFCNLLLADEINRASPKTQSALLEVMEERKVSVEGITRELPNPFLVIATQNPAGSAGTQVLPESQMDRFMVSLSLGYPAFEYEVSMAMSLGTKSRTESVRPVFGGQDLLQMQEEVHAIYMKEEVYRYLVRLVASTRDNPYLEKGASPRATIALVRMAKSAAWYDGRFFVTPKDVTEQFLYTVPHRITANASARMEGLSKEQILRGIIEQTRKPTLWEKGK